MILTVVTVMFAASGMRFLYFINDGRYFFSKENPQLLALEALENTFTKNENVLFTIAPKDGNIFTKETLFAIEDLTEKAWKIPYSSRVDSITNYQHTTVIDDDLVVEDLVRDAKNLSDEDIGRIKDIALNEPLIVNRLVSGNGSVTGINVNVLKPKNAPEDVSTRVTAYAREMVKDFRERHKGIDIYISGGILLDNAFGEVSQQDMQTIIPLMYLVLLVIMAVALKSVIGTITTLIIILMSMFTGLGVAGWLGIPMSAASVNAPTIILTLAVADSIHIIVTVFQQMRMGKTKHEAIAESVRVNLQPVFITSLSTVIGFLSMNFSDAPPFHDLGNIVAIGVTAAFFYSVLFLPALLSVLPLRKKPRALKDGALWIDRLGDFVVTRRNEIFYGMIVLMLGASSGIFFIELNDSAIKYFDKRFELREASDFVNKNLSGINAIEYSLESGEPNGINDPEYLRVVDKFAKWYRSQPDVAHVLTITDIIKRLNKNMHGGDEAFYKIPESRELAAQYLLLYEMSVPFGLDLNDQINVEKSSTRMVVTIKDIYNRELREMDQKAGEWLAVNAPETMRQAGSGISMMWAHISKRNIEGMLAGSLLALVLISALLIIALRSFKLGLISLIPNLVPAFISFGIWGYFVGMVGLSVSVLIALTLGIVVDDTVHFMSKYLRARREMGKDPEAAVRYSFHTVGAALFITTVVLVAGFSILLLSGFKINANMGLMTAITITAAIIIDFFFLPTLLMKVEEK